MDILESGNGIRTARVCSSAVYFFIYSFKERFFFLRFYLFVFRKRGMEGEREGEKRQCVVVSHVPPTGELAHNPGMCPDWESNRQPFGLQVGAQLTEPHKPELEAFK